MDEKYKLVEVEFKDLAVGMAFLRKADELEYERIDLTHLKDETLRTYNAGCLEGACIRMLDDDETVLIPKITHDRGKPYQIGEQE